MKPEVKESKSQTDNVNLNDAEVQTDPSDVFVKVKEVSKIYKIYVKGSLQDRISEELGSFFEESKINELKRLGVGSSPKASLHLQQPAC